MAIPWTKIIELVAKILKEIVGNGGFTIPISVIQPILTTIAIVCLAVLAFSLLYSLAFLVLTIISRAKMFKAAGEKRFKAIIPVYEKLVTYRLTWNRTAFWVYFILLSSACILFAIGTAMAVIVTGPAIRDFFESIVPGAAPFVSLPANATAVIVMLVIAAVSLILFLACSVMEIVLRYKISKSYNHGIGYFIGLVFFHEIFYLMIGFDSALTYRGNSAARREERKGKKAGADKPPVLTEVFPEEAPDAALHESETTDAPADEAPHSEDSENVSMESGFESALEESEKEAQEVLQEETAEETVFAETPEEEPEKKPDPTNEID